MSNVKMPIDVLLDRVGALPTMPTVARRVSEIINDPKSSMADLAGVIKLDQSMASLVLRWVNSAYYSLIQPVTTVEQAATFLGYRTVQNLVLSAAVANFMSKPIKGYALERGALWKHGVGTSAGARLIVQNIEPVLVDDAYYAGLFCDVGKLAFDVILQKLNYVIKPHKTKSFHKMEIEIFGYDHAAVSAAMTLRWKLPEYLGHVINFHHVPSKVEDKWKLLTYAVHAADAVMMGYIMGVEPDHLPYPLDPGVNDILKWNENSFTNLLKRITPVIAEIEAFLK
jgi:HD-like signal output (HDOD) protein